MDKLNLGSMTYEELCKLENEVAEAKKTFISMDSLYVFEDKDKVPHLCYISCYGNGTNASYADYYSTLTDVFDNSGVGRFRINHGSKEMFYRYLTANNITCCAKYYNKSELRNLWEPIKINLLNDLYDEEEKKIKDKRAALG